MKPSRILDAFAGSGCVGYALKDAGIEVHTNDFLRFSYHTCRATVENNNTTLSDTDVAFLSRKNRNAATFMQDTFKNLYFEDADNAFLDSLWANVQELSSPLKRSIALAAACRAAIEEAPQGHIHVYRQERLGHSARPQDEYAGAVLRGCKAAKPRCVLQWQAEPIALW